VIQFLSCAEISEQIFQQLLQTIQGLLSKVHKYSDLKLSIIATSAMRSAKNNAETAARIESIVGYPLKILSGTERVSMFSGWSKIFFASVYGFGLSVKTNFFGGFRWRQFGNISTEIRKKSEAVRMEIISTV